MKKKLLLLPLTLTLLVGGLTSCIELSGTSLEPAEKVYLSFRREIGVDLLAKSYDNPYLLFHTFDEKVERNGETKMEKRYIANEMEIQAMLDKGASFIVVAVPDFMCRCWKNFAENTLANFVTDTKADVYVVDSKTVLKNESWGIRTSGNDPVIAIMKDGKAVYQTAVKEGSDLATNKVILSDWVEKRVLWSKMYWVSEESDLQSILRGGGYFYYGRTSCPDCTYFETNFLFDYFENNQEGDGRLYYIDCDSEGRRYKNGEFDQEQWNTYKVSHGLAQKEDNPAGYGSGFVPTLMRAKTNEHDDLTVFSMDVYLNDTVRKNDEGHYIVEESYFNEERRGASYLSYINPYTPIEGKDLGTYEGEAIQAYYWYREKLAAFHNVFAKAFLDQMIMDANLVDSAN